MGDLSLRLARSQICASSPLPRSRATRPMALLVARLTSVVALLPWPQLTGSLPWTLPATWRTLAKSTSVTASVSSRPRARLAPLRFGRLVLLTLSPTRQNPRLAGLVRLRRSSPSTATRLAFQTPLLRITTVQVPWRQNPAPAVASVMRARANVPAFQDTRTWTALCRTRLPSKDSDYEVETIRRHRIAQASTSQCLNTV